MSATSAPRPSRRFRGRSKGMKSRQMLFVLSCCLALGVTTLSAANAAPEVRDAARLTPTATVSVVHAKFSPTKLQRKRIRAIKRLIKRAPRGSIAAQADVASARPVERAPGLGEAWIVSADDGSICTFIADAVDGYASSCATEADLRAGGSMTALAAAGTDGTGVEAQVVVVVPDRSPNPTIVRPDGSSQEIPIAGNTGSAVVGRGETIIAGAVRMTIPMTLPAKCDPPETTRRSRSCDS